MSATSWNGFKSEVCEARNMSIATIHSRLELEVVGFYLQKQDSALDSTSAYIGNKFLISHPNICRTCVIVL